MCDQVTTSMDTTSPPCLVVRERQLSILALLFFVALFLFTANGRMASMDGGQQLQNAMVLAQTGSLGAAIPPGLTEAPPSLKVHAAFVRGIDGRFYECHDLANILVMLPAAFVGVHTSRGRPIDPATPPLISKVLVSFTLALLSAVACFYLFRLFCLLISARAALLVTFLFVAATPFWSYVRTTEDVLGCCCAMCMLLYSAAALLAGRSVRANLIWSCFFLQLVGMFRLSVMPFFALSLLMVVWFARKYLRRPDVAWGTAAFVLFMTPTLWFNWIRTGSPFRAAITLPVYVSENANQNLHYVMPWHGLWGLTISPNKGLFVYCPFLLLIVGLPWAWKRLPFFVRSLLAAFLIGAALHVVLIACLAGWAGGWGYGPRYMFPLEPVFWVAASCVALVAWQRLRRAAFVLMALSLLVNLPMVLINGHLVLTEGFRARDEQRLPYAIIDAWQALLLGLRGRQMPGSPEEMSDPVRRLGLGFPDLWTVYVMRASHHLLGVCVGLFLTLLLLGTCWFTLVRFLRMTGTRKPNPTPVS